MTGKNFAVPFLLAMLLLTLVSLAKGRGLHSLTVQNMYGDTSALNISDVFFSVQGSGTFDAAMQQLSSGSKSFFLDSGYQEPGVAGVSAFSFLINPICVGYKSDSAVSYHFTITELGQLLRGDTTFFVTSAGVTKTVLPSSAIKVAVTRAYLYHLHNLTRADTARSYSAAVYGPDFIATALANPNVVVYSSVSKVLDHILNNPEAVGLLPPARTYKTAARCAPLDVVHPVTGTTQSLTPAADTEGTTMVESGANMYFTLDLTATAYPLVEPLAIYISDVHACSAKTPEWHEPLIHTLSQIVRNGIWKVGDIPPVAFNKQLTQLLSSTCHSFDVLPSLGSSAIETLVSAFSDYYITRDVRSRVKTNPLFVPYGSGGSGTGLRAIKADTHLFAGSDSMFSAQEFQDFPTVSFFPVTSFAVSVQFNLPGITSLRLPRCVAADIFAGRITQWNHPLIMQYNPTYTMPVAPITVVARSTSSGTTQIFTKGLNTVDSLCRAEAGSDIRVAKTWNISFPGLNLQTSTGRVVRKVLATPYSIGYGSASAVRLANGREATLVDEESGIETGPTTKALQAAVLTAQINPTTLEVNIQADANAYPFTGVSYFVTRLSRTTNCTSYRRMIQFLKWSITSTTASYLAQENFFVPLPPSIADVVALELENAICEEPVSKLTAGQIAGIVVGCLAALVLVIVLILATRKDGKNNSYAPTDATENITILFTDVESSTSLWARAPAEMGPALDLHNVVIRKMIAKHKAYEVKVIGDAFMIACKTSKQAAALAVDIQAGLADQDWEERIDDVYQELYEEKAFQHPNSNKLHHNAFSGLRVRVGMATGQCNPQFDVINKSWDYFGSTVNTASRVEAAGHGGQIVIDNTTKEEISDFVSNIDSKIIDLGDQLLKGYTEGMRLHQLTPTRFADRKFMELRCDHAGRDLTVSQDEDASDVESSLNAPASSKYSAHSGHTGRDQSVSGASASRDGSHSDTKRRVSISSHPELRIEDGTDIRDVVNTLFSVFPKGDQKDLLLKLCKQWRIETGKSSKHAEVVFTNLCLRVKGSLDSKLALEKKILSGSGMGRDSSSRSLKGRDRSRSVSSLGGKKDMSVYSVHTNGSSSHRSSPQESSMNQEGENGTNGEVKLAFRQVETE